MCNIWPLNDLNGLIMHLFQLFTLILLLGFSASSYAAPDKSPPSKPPVKTESMASVRPVYELDGSFGFCIGDRTYEDGRKITIALSPQNQINLGFTIPGGGFKIGSKYDLSLSLDEQAGRSVRAGALDENTLLLQMGAAPAFKKKLEASKKASVGAGAKVVAFDLPPMQTLFKDLQACLKNSAGTKDERAAKAEQAMPDTLKALLVTAGFTDIVPLQMKDIPPEERPADFIWRTGHVMAGIRERQAPEGKTLTDLIGLHMQGLKNKCVGSYKAEVAREQTIQTLHLRLAQASCGPKTGSQDKAVTVALLFYLTKAGGFTVFTHEATEAYKTEALAARDKLAEGLISLAQN